ncbi:SxtJ family membrane protein [Candidatus Pelagibacter sp.]|nr:SxtJ family membrane protein [Candidatus Pelagibacter sp.]|tara:strand:+ start:287 stop:670 length:384 start_codon:yes stop_codon:yes gene_type:complete
MSKIKVGSNKSFGIVFFVFFLIIGLYPLINEDNIRIWSIVISIIFLILGLINSQILTPLNILWFKFGMLLGRFVSPIVMGLVFFLVVTPTGLIMKLFNKDLLKLRKNKNSSYWIKRPETKSEMKNQF